MSYSRTKSPQPGSLMVLLDISKFLCNPPPHTHTHLTGCGLAPFKCCMANTRAVALLSARMLLRFSFFLSLHTFRLFLKWAVFCLLSRVWRSPVKSPQKAVKMFKASSTCVMSERRVLQKNGIKRFL